MKRKISSVFVFVLILLFSYSPGMSEIIKLKTGGLDDVIGINSFIMNGKGEIFLFSSRLSRIFKFKPDGTFEKKFCQKGAGPGDITRVIRMFHNPLNDFLYLPEFVSMAKGKVTIYDSEGNYKGLLKPDISLKHMDRIKKIIFLKNNSYFIVTEERVGWKPIGKLFITQNEIWVRSFNKDGKLISGIFKVKIIDELSNAVRYGGPQILFKPSLLVKLTPREHIAISRTDENTISIYNINGTKINTINLEISKEKLSDEEFNKAKKGLLKYFEKEKGSRMHYLAKNMIKLEYKKIYWGQFLTPNYIILEKTASRDDYGYIKTSKLIFFDWKGAKKGEKIVDGYVMNIHKGYGLIKYYDNDSNEHFKIEPDILDLKKIRSGG